MGQGIPKTPEDKIGMSFWRMHCRVRIILVKFHLGQMPPQECIAMLVEMVGHERAFADLLLDKRVGGGGEDERKTVL